MTRDERERLATLEQQMRDSREDITEMKSDVKAIRATLAEARGGWRVMVLLGGGSAALGAAIGRLLGAGSGGLS
ncbi:MAG: hypothetical protein KJ904_08690 [Alphaproteobacteria bacterium]|nr:hypothetical protein [Alphaproteobacteria bacterium]MBU0798973.1 hypothetical protein [Alphaproteobacteria bacterium]MBU0887228.1 hypothetical protein [Alphaproteobacteria bacterium]MBU1812244.1 hypothetical protein [Alphaproteobacteria bacterium]